MFRPILRHAAALGARLRGDAAGTSSVEYGLILAFIVLAMFAALQNLAGIVTELWHSIAAKVLAASPGI